MSEPFVLRPEPLGDDQGSPLDAAVATGLLGMVRALGIEGAKPGRRIDVAAAPGIAAGGLVVAP